MLTPTKPSLCAVLTVMCNWAFDHSGSRQCHVILQIMASNTFFVHTDYIVQQQLLTSEFRQECRPGFRSRYASLR